MGRAQDDSDRKRPVLSVTQVVASAAAATSAAVVASFFGVAGTVVGAAVVSAVATIANSLYSHSLARTNERLRSRLAATEATGARSRGLRLHRASPAPAGAPPAPAGAAAASGPSQTPHSQGRPRWLRPSVVTAGAAVLVFVVAMVIVTIIELGVGKSLHAAVSNQPGNQGTTVGDIVTGGTVVSHPSHNHTTPTPGASASQSPPPQATPGSTGPPTPTPSPAGSPSRTPTPTLGSPAPSPTTAPSGSPAGSPSR